MKVLYDYQTFTLQDYGGISRYFYEVNREFKSYTDLQTECTLFYSNNEYLFGNDVISYRSFFPKYKFSGRRTIMLIINEMRSRFLIKKGDFDLFHPTYYDPYYLNINMDKPVVITCLDLIHEKFIRDDLQTLSNKKKVLLRADKILAISQSTKNDLISYYKIPEERIDVTYLASSFKINSASVSPSSDESFVLYVGNRSLYKNFGFFVTAIAPLLKKGKDLFLYCAGGGQFNKEELALFNNLKIANKVRAFSGADESLTRLYSSAIAFFYPSLYEGFGIPLLEAMSCGCAVASSNVSSLPEVAGDAAYYFDPLSKDSIFAAAEEILANDHLRAKLKEKGFERAKQFSWQQTAQQTYKAYKKLV